MKLSKTRCLDWRNAFDAQLETMCARVFDASLPESFKELGGHYLLASLETNRDAALVEVLATYKDIKSAMVKPQFEIDSYELEDPYMRGDALNQYLSEEEEEEQEEEEQEEEQEEEEDDDESDYGGRQYGLTRVTINETDIITIIENVIQNNYCWDIGCQVQAYCSSKKLNGNKYTRKCFCPLGELHKKWQEETGVDIVVYNANIPLCNKGKFNSPYALWSHCRGVGQNCLIHFALQKLLENHMIKL